jgi:hypothetical protein
MRLALNEELPKLHQKGLVGMRIGLYISKKIENWLNDAWTRSKTREEIGNLLNAEYVQGNLTPQELKSAIKELYTSLR